MILFHLLQDSFHSFHHVKISQKSPVIMLKWTQTPYINDQHSFKWAIDGIIVGSYMGPTYDSHAKDASLTVISTFCKNFHMKFAKVS